MWKKKMIRQFVKQIIKEKYDEWLSDIEVFEYIKSLEPKNNIEKRTLQSMACIIGGYIKMNKWEFINDKLYSLLSYLKK